jgi:hypothetical protein
MLIQPSPRARILLSKDRKMHTKRFRELGEYYIASRRQIHSYLDAFK